MSTAQLVVFDTPQPVLATAFNAAAQKVVRWVDIYQYDNTTIWQSRVPLIDGSVNVDMSRAERRNVDLTLLDIDNGLPHSPDGLWYDKIIKPYAGIEVAGVEYVTCLGEFLIDKIDRQNFPNTIQITGRDFAKRLGLDLLTQTTAFAAGASYESIIRTIATNGGITKFNLSPTGKTTAATFTFERGTERWKVLDDLATAVGNEIFFDNFGYLTLRPFVDPVTAPVSYSFTTGATGNIVSFKKSADDSRLRNHVIVYGDGTNNPLVFAEAENTAVASPTRIARIGRRTYTFASKFIDTNANALEVANRYLKVMALEQYDIGIEAINAPWLEAGDAIEFLDPSASADQPTRYMMASFSIPLGLAPMSVTAKRVHLVA